MINLQDLQNLKFGEQVIIQDPIFQTKTPYAFISKDDDGTLYFISSYGASFIIKDQKTADVFEVELISPTHPLWDEGLFLKGQQTGLLLSCASGIFS